MKKKIGITLLIILCSVIAIGCIIMVREMIYQVQYRKGLNAVMEDDLEIEKKWLIKKELIPYDLSKMERIEIEQTYICFSPEIRVRRINGGSQYTFAVKTNITEDGMTRNELEENITQEEYHNLISKKEGNTIHKTRYQFLEGNQILAIDIFSGKLEGLAYLEIEFKDQEEAQNYKAPDWVMKDVTSDLSYKNGHLARYGIPSSFQQYMK